MSSPTPVQKLRSGRKLICVGVGAIVIATMALPAYMMNAHPVKIGSLSTVTTSSTQEDVKALLGKPSHIDSESGNVSWRYSGFMWCIVTVVFGPDGKVTSIDHDH